MADTKVSAFGAIPAIDTAADLIPIIDASASGSAKNKTVTPAALATAIGAAIQTPGWTWVAGGGTPVAGKFTTDDVSPASTTAIKILSTPLSNFAGAAKLLLIVTNASASYQFTVDSVGFSTGVTTFNVQYAGVNVGTLTNWTGNSYITFASILIAGTDYVAPTGDGSGLTNLNPANLASAIGVPQGGTGLVTIPANRIVLGNGTSPANVMDDGVLGQAALSQGPGADPQWGDVLQAPDLVGVNSVTSASGHDLTLTTLDGNKNIILSPNGTGYVSVANLALGIVDFDLPPAGLKYIKRRSSGDGDVAFYTDIANDHGVAFTESNAGLAAIFDFDNRLFKFFGSIRLGDGTNGPTLTASGSSPNEDLIATPGGTGRFRVGVQLATIGGIIFDHYANVSSTSTNGTEDDLYSDTLAAGLLVNNGEKVVESEYISLASSATAARRVKKYFGGTLIFDSGALTLAAGADGRMLTEVIRESSSVVRVTVTVSTTSASTIPYVTFTRVTGLTLANTQILKTTAIASGTGAASGDIVNKMANIAWHPAA